MCLDQLGTTLDKSLVSPLLLFESRIKTKYLDCSNADCNGPNINSSPQTHDMTESPLKPEDFENQGTMSFNHGAEPHQCGGSLSGDGRDQSASVYTVFDKATRRWIIFLVALAGFFSPLSANIYFPALNYIAESLHVSLELMNLTITAYLVCQGIVQYIVGGLADILGRRPLYLAAFTIYVAANIGLAVQTSYPALMVLRILQSSGSSGW